MVSKEDFQELLYSKVHDLYFMDLIMSILVA